MSTHAGALFTAVLAYTFAHHHSHDEPFSFGTGKVGELVLIRVMAVGSLSVMVLFLKSSARPSGSNTAPTVVVLFDWLSRAAPIKAAGMGLLRL